MPRGLRGAPPHPAGKTNPRQGARADQSVVASSGEEAPILGGKKPLPGTREDQSAAENSGAGHQSSGRPSLRRADQSLAGISSGPIHGRGVRLLRGARQPGSSPCGPARDQVRPPKAGGAQGGDPGRRPLLLCLACRMGGLRRSRTTGLDRAGDSDSPGAAGAPAARPLPVCGVGGSEAAPAVHPNLHCP